MEMCVTLHFISLYVINSASVIFLNDKSQHVTADGPNCMRISLGLYLYLFNSIYYLLVK